ncbi:MAG: hypothetical protein SFZ24_07140 [Planctomycetota bacterium]|nr:hypothetical protein [Planctomycetota bacterium]
MTDQPHQPDFNPVDLYVDGVMTPDSRARFEALLERDAALRAEVEAARAVDAGLRRAFAAPRLTAPEMPASEAPAPLAAGRPDAGPAEGRRPRTLRLTGRGIGYAAAALLGLSSLAGLYIYNRQFNFPQGGSTTVARITPAELYGRLVDKGFKPEFVCKDDAEFAAATRDRLGQPLLLAQSADVKVLGWAYAGSYRDLTVSFNTLILMTEVKGKPVIVLMDHVRNDRVLPLPEPESGLSMHRRNVGDMMLVEINPFGRAKVLPLAYNPDVEGPPPVPTKKKHGDQSK